jgi:hypothetical protein
MTSDDAVKNIPNLPPHVRDAAEASRYLRDILMRHNSIYPSADDELAVVRALIAAGADVSKQFVALEFSYVGLGRTTLLETVFCSRWYNPFPYIAALLAAGADPNARVGGEPLSRMAIARIRNTFGSVPTALAVVDAFLAAGARVNAIVDGVQPILGVVIFNRMSGLGYGDRESCAVMHRLVAAGARLRTWTNAKSPLAKSPLRYLTRRTDFEDARYLIRAGWELDGERLDEYVIQLDGDVPYDWTFAGNERILAKIAPPISAYVGELRRLQRNASSLQELCRRSIRAQLSIATDDRDIEPFARRLPLPAALRRYVTCDDDGGVF